LIVDFATSGNSYFLQSLTTPDSVTGNVGYVYNLATDLNGNDISGLVPASSLQGGRINHMFTLLFGHSIQYFCEQAAAALRHYPTAYDLKLLSDAAPHVVQERMEPLYKMVLSRSLQEQIAADAGIDISEGGDPD
jgi:hypothetical protein